MVVVVRVTGSLRVAVHHVQNNSVLLSKNLGVYKCQRGDGLTRVKTSSVLKAGDSTILELVVGVHGRSQDGFAVECRV